MADVLVVDDEFAVRTLAARWLTAQPTLSICCAIRGISHCHDRPGKAWRS